MRRTLLLAATLATLSLAAYDYETKSWGECWKRPAYMPAAIGVTNSIGADGWRGMRIPRTFPYDFLDGYDTRAWIMNGHTNEVPESAKSTNVTRRLVQYAAFTTRKDSLRNMICGSGEGGRWWGSSALDETLEDLGFPLAHEFSFTSAPLTEWRLSSGGTGWFASPHALDPTPGFPAEPDGYHGKDGILFAALPYLSYHEPSTELSRFIIRQATAEYEHATPNIGFTAILSNCFDVASNDIENATRRLCLTNTIAHAYRALSAYDGIYTPVVSFACISNELWGYAKAVASTTGTLSSPVVVERTSDGYRAKFQCDPAQPSVSWSSTTIAENSLVVSNAPCYDTRSPRLRLSSPTFTVGIGSQTTIGGYSFSLDDPTFVRALERVLDPVGDGVWDVTISFSREDGTVWANLLFDIYSSGTWRVPMPDPTSFSNTVTVTLSGTSAYTYKTTDRVPTSPWWDYTYWPSSLYLDQNTASFLLSYFGLGTNVAWETDIDFEYDATDPLWAMRDEYGYATKMYQYGVSSLFWDKLRAATGELQSEIESRALGAWKSDPADYTNVRAATSEAAQAAGNWSVALVGSGGDLTNSTFRVTKSNYQIVSIDPEEIVAGGYQIQVTGSTTYEYQAPLGYSADTKWYGVIRSDFKFPQLQRTSSNEE